MKNSIRLVALSLAMFVGTIVSFPTKVLAENPFTTTPSPDDLNRLGRSGVSLVEKAPTLALYSMVVVALAAIGVILIKTLSPLGGDSEEKFTKGKKWFQGAGVLLIAPAILIIVFVLVYTAMGYGNPLTLMSRSFEDVTGISTTSRP